MKTKILSFLMFILVPVGFAKAEPVAYEFDQTHSQVIFFVNHMGFSYSEGEFQEIDGGFTFDSDNPANSSIDVSIPVSSLDMDDETWDEHVKGEDFFNAAEYPDMFFKSTDIEITGENTAKITGDFTLLGVTKPVVLDVTFNKAGEHPMTKRQMAGFSATTKIKRSEFGMKGGLPMVGDDVDIRIEIEAMRKTDNSELDS